MKISYSIGTEYLDSTIRKIFNQVSKNLHCLIGKQVYRVYQVKQINDRDFNLVRYREKSFKVTILKEGDCVSFKN